MPKEIMLTQGKVAIVDEEDFEWLNQWKWFSKSGRYAMRKLPHKKGMAGVRKEIFMHRLITGVTDLHIKVDHKDRNGLNNQRQNLRLVNSLQNAWNRKKITGSKSKYIGVSVRCRTKKLIDGSTVSYNYFESRILGANGERISLGTFYSEMEAALAFNIAALNDRKEFANINVLPDNYLEIINNEKSDLLSNKERDRIYYLSNKKKVVKLNNDDESLICIYNSIGNAALDLGKKGYCRNIISVCKGREKTYYGYKWMYHNEYEKLNKL